MKTEIAFILDRSGSMSSMTHAAIAGFNEFLTAQQNTMDDHGQPLAGTFSLILFDHEYLPIYDRIPLAEASALTTSTYVPRGNTALLDAIGRTIDDLGQKLAATADAERPTKVIVAILTDGEENSSRRFTIHDISQRITHQSEAYQWEFLFLGANQDAIATAAHMGISPQFAATFGADDADMHAVQEAVAGKVSAMRKSAAGVVLADLEQETLKETMHATVEKSRKK
jgi:uncharacterized protein YegL